MGKRIDLHTHSIFSDGELLPSEIARRACVLGHQAVAITDHVDASNLDCVGRVINAVLDIRDNWDIEIVPGGEERADSVQNALARVKADIDYVAIHDAARPLITDKWVGELFAAAEKHHAVIPAVRVSSTLKRAGKDRQIQETVDRTDLWAAQTPQVFQRQILLDAYAKRGDFQPTDEAQLVEHIGQAVTIVEGSPLNQKITTAADFKMAEALVNALPKPKGIQALHPFADEEPRGIL